MTESFLSMNETLISSINKYESNIVFSDTMIRNHNICLNTKLVVNNYYKSLELAGNKNTIMS